LLLSPREFAKTIVGLDGEQRRQAIKEFLSKIEDPAERDEADSFLIAFPDGIDDAPETVIVLIHGINTAGEWQDRIADRFIEEHGLRTYPVGYGVVDLLRFLFPFGTRDFFVRTVDEKLRTVKELHPGANVCVVAHSFGTYIITRLLREQADLKLDRLLLCGSVVPLAFRWRKVLGQVGLHRIVNEVGTRDVWPVVARAVTFGYGPSGTLGFKYPGVRDRFHDYEHSDYFEDAHVRQFWEPFLLDGRIVPCVHTRERSTTAEWARFFSWFPLRYLIWATLAYGGFKLACNAARFLGIGLLSCIG
jgi:pimeloyl-ACP methyl ester carboxylesterase